MALLGMGEGTLETVPIVKVAGCMEPVVAGRMEPEVAEGRQMRKVAEGR